MLAGPVEATVMGNVLVQALAKGLVASPTEIREAVRRSTALAEYEPRGGAIWEDMYAKYLRLLEQSKR